MAKVTEAEAKGAKVTGYVVARDSKGKELGRVPMVTLADGRKAVIGKTIDQIEY